MAIVVNQAPPAIAFSLNPIIYELQANDIVQVTGVAAVNTVTFTAAITAGIYISLQYNGSEVRFLAAAVPNNAGNEFPLSATPDASYVASLIPFFQNNYYIEQDYVVTSSGTTLIFTAKKTGTAFNFRPVTYQSGAVAQSTPAVDEVRKPNFAIYVEVNLMADDNSLTKIYGQPYEVDTVGIAKIDISKILNAHLEADLPPLNGDKSQRCVKSNQKYVLRVAEASGVPFNIGILAQLEPRRVMLGGVPYESGPGQTPITVTQGSVVTDDTALRVGSTTRTTRTDEPQYLSFLLSRAVSTETIRLVCILNFSDNTTQTVTGILSFAGALVNNSYQFAVGFTDLNLSSYESPTKFVTRYTLQLTNSVGGVRSGIYTYNVDREWKPYSRYFLYVNSLGALDTAITYGKGSETWAFSKQTAERYRGQNYEFTDGEATDFDITGNVKFEVASGFLRSKAEVRHFAEMFLSRWKYRRHNGHDLPITVNTKEMKLAQDGDGRHVVSFEYQYQFDHNLFSSETLDGEWFDLIPPPFTGGGTNTSWAWIIESETNPDVPDWILNISQQDIANWNSSFSWENHEGAGYLLAADAALEYATNERVNALEELVGGEAYSNRRLKSNAFDVRELPIGSTKIARTDWTGIDYAPYGLEPRGHFQVFIGDDLIEITYTDDAGKSATFSNSGGQYYLETNAETGEEEEKVTEPGEFPPVWTYLRTEEQPEYDEEGNQLLHLLSIERGKVRESVSRAIRKGAEYKGIFTVGDVLYAIPSVPENRPVRSVEGFAVWQIENWSNVIHGPENWTGPGLLIVGYFGESVIFEAFNDSTNAYAYALKPNAASPLGAWQKSGGLYFTKDEILYLLSQYAQKDHTHDDRYPTITYLLNILNNYQSAVWRPTVEEVIGLNYALSQLVSKDLFNYSGDYGFLAGVGEDNQPALFDMSKTKLNAGVLSIGKVGVPYFFLISKDEFIWPRGAINKYVIATTLEPWLTITWNPTTGLVFEGTPTEKTNIVIGIRVGYRLSARSQTTYETHVVMFRILEADAVITAPTAPGSFTATAVSSTGIVLTWTDSANENVYEVWFRPVGGSYVKIATLPANTLSFEHTGLTPETEYEYELRAVNLTGTATATDSDTTLEAVVIGSGSLYGRYFNALDLDETVGETGHRNDAVIDFSWNGTSPFAGVSGAAFSLRESGFVTVPVNGNYQFRFTANDGIRVWMNGQIRIDKWQERAATSEVFSLNLLANSPVSIIIEYYNSGGSGAALKMEILQGANYIVIPSAYLTPDPALGVKINAPVLSAAAADATTVDLDWTFGGAVTVFNMVGGLVANNLADIGNVAGTDRARIVGGLPTGQTFYFRIRAVNASGRFGGWSNVATVTLSNTGTNPNPADPVIIARGGTDNIIVTASDNNEGSGESYEYNFRGVGETDWKTLKSDFSLSATLSEFGLFSNGPISIIAQDFEGKRIETRVRVHKSGLLSEWSQVVRELPVTPVAREIICFPGKFNVRQNPDGSYSDIAVQEEGGFRAFYTIDVAYDTSFYNSDGTPRSFTNVFLPNDSLLSLRKIMMSKSVFPTVQAFQTKGWLANIGADESLIGDCSGAVVRTGNVTGGGGPVDPEEPPQVRAIDHMQTMVVPAMLYIMNYGSFRTDEIKEKMIILKNSGYKGVAVTFTPFKVWSNYTSPGAFDPDNLTFDPTELNKIIFHCCNTLGMKLFARLDANFSAFALRNMGSTTTDDLLIAWDSYFYHKDGEPNSLRFDNVNTPPWQLFKKFCAWFRGQYNNYWQSGKIQMWEGGYEFHQEMTYNPESWDLSYPNPTEYAERTQDLYDANEALRTAMGDWGDEFSGDAVCNVGSVSDVLAIGLRNTVDYNTYAQNYRGLKSNHGSDWTQDERDLSDMILYSWAQVNYNTFGITHRYFAVEYFKEGNQFTVSGMADSIERTLNNGALYVYAIFDGPVNEFQNFYGQLASVLTTRGAMDKRRVFPQTNGNIFISVEAARTNGIFQQLGANPSVLQTYLNQKNSNNGVPVRVYIES